MKREGKWNNIVRQWIRMHPPTAPPAEKSLSSRSDSSGEEIAEQEVDVWELLTYAANALKTFDKSQLKKGTRVFVPESRQVGTVQSVTRSVEGKIYTVKIASDFGGGQWSGSAEKLANGYSVEDIEFANGMSENIAKGNLAWLQDWVKSPHDHPESDYGPKEKYKETHSLQAHNLLSLSRELMVINQRQENLFKLVNPGSVTGNDDFHFKIKRHERADTYYRLLMSELEEAIKKPMLEPLDVPAEQNLEEPFRSVSQQEADAALDEAYARGFITAPVVPPSLTEDDAIDEDEMDAAHDQFEFDEIIHAKRAAAGGSYQPNPIVMRDVLNSVVQKYSASDGNGKSSGLVLLAQKQFAVDWATGQQNSIMERKQYRKYLIEIEKKANKNSQLLRCSICEKAEVAFFCQSGFHPCKECARPRQYMETQHFRFETSSSYMGSRTLVQVSGEPYTGEEPKVVENWLAEKIKVLPKAEESRPIAKALLLRIYEVDPEAFVNDATRKDADGAAERPTILQFYDMLDRVYPVSGGEPADQSGGPVHAGMPASGPGSVDLMGPSMVEVFKQSTKTMQNAETLAAIVGRVKTNAIDCDERQLHWSQGKLSKITGKINLRETKDADYVVDALKAYEDKKGAFQGEWEPPDALISSNTHAPSATQGFHFFSWNVLAEFLSTKQLVTRSWKQLKWEARWPRIREVLKSQMLSVENPVICLQEVQDSNVDRLNHRKQIQQFLEQNGMACIYAPEGTRSPNKTILKEMGMQLSSADVSTAPVSVDRYSALGPCLGKNEKTKATEPQPKYCKGVLLAWKQAPSTVSTTFPSTIGMFATPKEAAWQCSVRAACSAPRETPADVAAAAEVQSEKQQDLSGWRVSDGKQPEVIRFQGDPAQTEMLTGRINAALREKGKDNIKAHCEKIVKEVGQTTAAIIAPLELCDNRGTVIMRVVAATTHSPVPVDKVGDVKELTGGGDSKMHETIDKELKFVKDNFPATVYQARVTLEAIKTAGGDSADVTSIFCGDLNTKPHQVTCRFLKQPNLAMDSADASRLVVKYTVDNERHEISVAELFQEDGTGISNPFGGMEGPVQPYEGEYSPLFPTTSSGDFTERIDHIYYKPAESVALTGVLRQLPQEFADQVRQLHYPNEHVPSDHLWSGAKFQVVAEEPSAGSPAGGGAAAKKPQ
jgi:endonuclease/exonuclease/phosphatase family metal-dependent hydrolase